MDDQLSDRSPKETVPTDEQLQSPTDDEPTGEELIKSDTDIAADASLESESVKSPEDTSGSARAENDTSSVKPIDETSGSAKAENDTPESNITHTEKVQEDQPEKDETEESQAKSGQTSRSLSESDEVIKSDLTEQEVSTKEDDVASEGNIFIPQVLYY